MSRGLQLALLVGGFAAAVFVLFLPVQRHFGQDNGALWFLISAIVILPFVALPLVVRPLQRVTRHAWILAALMAPDLIFMAIGMFAPTGGHPSFEAMGSYFLGLAKPVLVVAALVLLSIGFLRGERFIVVALGLVCLLGETLFGFTPIAWLFGD